MRPSGIRRLAPVVGRSIVRLLSLSALALAAAPAVATVFTVINTDDSGAGSLRAALLSAQTCAGGPHTIAFDVPLVNLTAGVAVITPSSTALPAITCAGTTVDGTTQTTNKGNTNDVTLGSGGTVGTGPDGRAGTGDELPLSQLNGPEVEIVGTNLSSGILDVAANTVTIKGLSLHGGGDFSGNGTGSGTIHIQSGTGVSIQGNVLGASATSYTEPAAQTQDNLVLITGGTSHVIQQNLLGFCRWRMILMFSPTGNVTIQNNELTGSPDGIDLSSPGFGPTGVVSINRNLLHDADAQDNLTTQFGIFITQTSLGSLSASSNTVKNVGTGLIIDSTRPVLLLNNIISDNTGDGISQFQGSEPISIIQSSIFDNLLGIDMVADGVTPNDGVGPPGTMDYPIFTMATVSAGLLQVAGFVGNNPAGSATFANAVIHVFKADNAPANQNGPIILGDGMSVPHGEGAVFLGQFVADALGKFNTLIAVPVGVMLFSGDQITGIAEGPVAAGATAPRAVARPLVGRGDDEPPPVGAGYSSEFGPNIVLGAIPRRPRRRPSRRRRPRRRPALRPLPRPSPPPTPRPRARRRPPRRRRPRPRRGPTRRLRPRP